MARRSRPGHVVRVRWHRAGDAHGARAQRRRGRCPNWPPPCLAHGRRSVGRASRWQEDGEGGDAGVA